LLVLLGQLRVQLSPKCGKWQQQQQLLLRLLAACKCVRCKGGGDCLVQYKQEPLDAVQCLTQVLVALLLLNRLLLAVVAW
jgi:hypothetical protein